MRLGTFTIYGQKSVNFVILQIDLKTYGQNLALTYGSITYWEKNYEIDPHHIANFFWIKIARVAAKFDAKVGLYASDKISNLSNWTYPLAHAS